MSLVIAPLVITTLALAPAPIAPKRRERTYDLIDVRWQIALSATKPGQITGTATNTLKLFPGKRAVTLDCGELIIDAVTVNGIKKSFTRSGSTLTIPSAGQAGKPLKVAVRYHGTPQSGMYYIPAERAYPAKTPVYYTQGEMEDNQHWLPTYDYPDDKATTEGMITVPKGWSVLSNGRLEKKTAVGQTETWHWKMDQPHVTYLISFVAGPYSEIVERPSNPKVSFWVPKGLEEMGKVSFLGTAKNVEVFGKLTGFPYPYTKYAQSAVPDFMFGGMENITCTTQTIDTLHPASIHPLEDSTGLVAHELAHQWFGDTVTTPNWSHIWINEGWATFMPAFFEREKNGQDAFHLARVDTLANGLGAHENSSRPMVWFDYKDPIDMFDGFAYPGGASRMFMLMRLLGEDRFWAITKNYLNTFKYKNVDTEQFFTFWSKQSGQDLDWFRKQWFYTPAAPKLTVKREGRRWWIEQKAPFFRIPTDVLIVRDNQPAFQKVTLNGAKTELPFEADLVQLDPAAWLMADIRYDAGLTANEWMSMWKVAPNAGQRARLMGPVFGALNEAQKLEVAALPVTKPLLNRVIDRISDEAYLRSKLSDDNVFVRSAVVQRLGRVKSNPQILAALRTVSEQDANPAIQLQAYRIVLDQTKSAEMAEKAWLRDSHKEGFRKLAMDHWAEHDPKRARGVCLAQLRQPRNEALREQAVRILGRLKDEPGKTEVLDALMKIAVEPSFGTRVAAIDALASYGDKRAIPAIRKAENHPLVFIRGQARGAIARLGG